MACRFTSHVLQTLARQLGVPTREIALGHDLYADWHFTPLSLVVVLIDLERSAGRELPAEELTAVRRVIDLVQKFRDWRRANDAPLEPLLRLSRHALRARRLRRELHRLRWLEGNERAQAIRMRERVRRPSPAPRAAGVTASGFLV